MHFNSWIIFSVGNFIEMLCDRKRWDSGWSSWLRRSQTSRSSWLTVNSESIRRERFAPHHTHIHCFNVTASQMLLVILRFLKWFGWFSELLEPTGLIFRANLCPRWYVHTSALLVQSLGSLCFFFFCLTNIKSLAAKRFSCGMHSQ